MAGFVLKSLDGKRLGIIGNIQKNIRDLASLGMKWDEKIIKQSKSIGIAEAQLDNMYGLYYQGNYAGTDYGQKEFIAFYDKEYPTRRDFLRKFSMNGEIENVLEIIADETIIYDDNNYFGYPNTKNLKSVIKQEKAKEIVDDLNEAFRKVYYAFKFNQSHDAWHYLKKFLIDGFLSFEIIYDGEGEENAKNIIALKEIDPIELEPEIRINKDNGQEYRVWVQFRGDSRKQRELLDSNLIYISWARGNFISRLSYVERLVRSFNMMRTLENSRIIWNVWNAQMRVKILVPIGSQSDAKARTRLSELRGMYKEELNIDDTSGEVTYNGSPQFNFAKTFVIPTREGVQTEIDGFQPAGYDLSNTESLQYFWQRFVVETKVPGNRFSNNTEGSTTATWGTGGEGIAREELRFSNFINRIRSIYQEVLLKPLWIQFILKHPEFKEDEILKGSIGLEFVEENLFKKMKERDLAEKGANTVTTLSNIKEPTVNPDGTPGEKNFFDPKFLVEKFMEFTEQDIKLNAKYKIEREEEIKKLARAYARIIVASGGTPGAAGGGGELGGGGFGGLGGGGEAGGFGGAGGFGEEIGGAGGEEIGGAGGEAGGGEATAGGEELGL
ncbi:MAG: portal protein [Candidatus Nanoarchaeia archaeon]|nr:portal protein [Candidatus Nanoarchaeia archaeon]